jgi:ABC-type sugar transport system substrate-binding protein
VKLVAEQPANFDRAQGLTVMENILQGNKNIQAVLAQNDEMALGAERAIQEAGLKNVDTAKLLIEGKLVDRNIPVPLGLVTQ